MTLNRLNMKKYFPIFILVCVIMSSCKKKYIAMFKKEGTNSFPTGAGIPEQKEFSAKNDEAAYKKAVAMVIDLEKNNDDNDYAYKGVIVFYAKSKSYISLGDDRIRIIENEASMNSYLLDRFQQKRNSNNYISPLIKHQREQENKLKLNLKKP